MVYYSKDFSPKEIEMGKEYISKAIYGLLAVKMPEYTAQVDALLGKGIRGENTIAFSLTINTIGNDLLAAMGAARNEIAKLE